MLRKLSLLLLLTTLAVGQTQYNYGDLAVSLSGVAATGAGTAFVYQIKDGRTATNITWQTKFTGTPTAITTNLEGSIDNLTWAQLDQSTSTAGEMRHVTDKGVKFLRCNIAVYTVNGSTATCQFVAVIN